MSTGQPVHLKKEKCEMDTTIELITGQEILVDGGRDIARSDRSD